MQCSRTRKPYLLLRDDNLCAGGIVCAGDGVTEEAHGSDHLAGPAHPIWEVGGVPHHLPPHQTIHDAWRVHCIHVCTWYLGMHGCSLRLSGSTVISNKSRRLICLFDLPRCGAITMIQNGP